MSQFTHLSPKIQQALDDYDAMIADGTIVIRPAGFGEVQYPGKCEADMQLALWCAGHLPHVISFGKDPVWERSVYAQYHT